MTLMSKDVFRRCGCRDENGKQLAAACPKLKTDAKHGTWSYSASAGSSAGSGKRQQLRKSGFTTKKEAQNALATARTLAAAGRLPTDNKLTVAQFLTTWLQRKEEDGLRPSTLAMYRSFVMSDLIPAMGATKLVELSRRQVDAFVRGLLPSETRGPSTVRRIHGTLSSAMSTAMRLGLIDANPAANVQLPQVKKFRAAMWEPEQAAEFLTAVAPLRLAPLFHTAVHTGLRRGELCGLRWEDVSFTERELVVRVQLTSIGGKTYEGAIKTNSGQDRRVSLDDGLMDTLTTWKLRQDEEREH